MIVTSFVLIATLLIALLAAGFWVGLSLLIAGIAGFVLLGADNPGGLIVSTLFASINSWPLTALPLFLLMGEILFRSSISDDMFRGLAPLVRWLPGKLLHVNVLACGVLAAIVGSSGVCCATVGRMSVPELTRQGYSERMIIGTLTGSGTLGILIPPSIMMIVYGMVSQTSISRLFLAGIVPGALIMLLFMGYIVVWSLLNPAGVPATQPKASWKDLRRILPPIALIVAIIGSIYAGYATPTESAALGVLGSLALAAWGGTLTAKMMTESFLGGVRNSALIILILAGASVLSAALDFGEMPQSAARLVQRMGLSQHELLIALTLLYLILGCFLDGVSMIVLTAPLILPMTAAVGIDPVWFGIYLVVIIELAQLTPPVGFNLFILQAMTNRDLFTVTRASIPFFLLLLASIVIFALFPQLVTLLPQTVFGK